MKKNIFKIDNESKLDSLIKKFSDKIIFVIFIDDFYKKINNSVIKNSKHLLASNHPDSIVILVDINNYINTNQYFIKNNMDRSLFPFVLGYYNLDHILILKNVDIPHSYPLFHNAIKIINLHKLNSNITIPNNQINEVDNDDDIDSPSNNLIHPPIPIVKTNPSSTNLDNLNNLNITENITHKSSISPSLPTNIDSSPPSPSKNTDDICELVNGKLVCKKKKKDIKTLESYEDLIGVIDRERDVDPKNFNIVSHKNEFDKLWNDDIIVNDH